jgi:F-type H+-transporting ATPase subunit b
MSFSWSTFALQVINFLVLIWLLKRFLFKPVSAMVAARKAEIAKAQAESEAARQSAELSRREFDRRRLEIDAQREAITEQGLSQLASERTRMLEAAQAEIDKLKSAMLKQLDQERERAADEVSKHAVEIAVQLAGRLLQQCAVPPLDEIFLERLLGYLDHLTAAERAALIDQAGPEREALFVTTASPLDAEREARWREALRRSLGVSAQITFTVDNSLIAGTELKFSLGVLRFSWRQALMDAQQELNHSEHAG